MSMSDLDKIKEDSFKQGIVWALNAFFGGSVSMVDPKNSVVTVEYTARTERSAETWKCVLNRKNTPVQNLRELILALRQQRWYAERRANVDASNVKLDCGDEPETDEPDEIVVE